MTPAATQRATTFQLVFMVYTAICGGAYGLEPMISASGPGLALLLLVLLPIVWASPMALACAELSSRLPVEGGYYRWSRGAFGDFVGYMSGFLTWLAMFATNALYVVLFVGYLGHWVPELGGGTRFLVGAALIWACVALNVLGIRLVGSASVVMMVLCLLPFVPMTVLGLARWRFDPTSPLLATGKSLPVALADGLLVAFWLYSGYEKLSVLAGEVEEPARSFPRALAFAVPLSALSYVAPPFAALAAEGDWAAWGDFHFARVGAQMGGAALAGLVVFGGLVSNAGLLLVTMTGQSRLPMVLADDGLFPRAFARIDPRFGTPVWSLAFGGVVLTLLSAFPFASLIALYGPVQAGAYLLIYAALLRLRERAAEQPGAFRIPLATARLRLLIAPGILLMLVVVGLGLGSRLWHDGRLDLDQALRQAALVAAGPLSYWLFRRIRRAPAALAP